MARTALYAPAHRVLGRSALNQNPPGNFPNAAPSIDYLGQGFQDHRLPWNTANSPSGAQVLGWYGAGLLCLVDQAPSTIAVANIAAAQATVSGTGMTLVSVSGAGVTVLPTGGQLWYPFLNTVPAGAVIIDGVQALVRIGRTDISSFYDPTAAITRAVSVTGNAGSVGGTFVVNGINYYGQTQTQNLVHAGGATTITSTKMFKGVVSVVPNFTDAGHLYSVGTGDVFGINMAVDFFGYTKMLWIDVLQAVSTFTAAVTTSPATATTGDPMGKFTPGSASNGTNRLQIFVTPSIARANGLPWGVTPV